MPFTLSHPAIVVPLARRGWLLSALVAGSMAPDAEYFLRLTLRTERYGHTPAGALLAALPAALIGLWIFHRILKRPLLALLPESVRRRLEPFAGPFPFGPPPRFLRIACAALIGIGSHLLWDLFTHPNGWSGLPLEMLLHPLIDSPFGVVRTYEGLHVLSSVAGLVLLFCWGRRWWRAGEPSPTRPARGQPAVPALMDAARRHAGPLALWAGALGTAVLAALLHASRAGSPFADYLALRHFLCSVAVCGISSLIAELLLLSILWHVSPVVRGALQTLVELNANKIKESEDERNIEAGI